MPPPPPRGHAPLDTTASAAGAGGTHWEGAGLWGLFGPQSAEPFWGALPSGPTITSNAIDDLAAHDSLHPQHLAHVFASPCHCQSQCLRQSNTGPASVAMGACTACSAVFKNADFFLLRTALKDRSPPTADRCQPPTAANRRQPLPTAANRRQPPTAANRCQA